MAICKKCGKEIDENLDVCPLCGADLKEEAAEDTSTKSDFNQKLKDINNTKDTTDEFDPQDIENNKAMGVLAYLSWLIIIPLLAAKDSKFARFHCNQGLVLAIAELVAVVVLGILSLIPFIGWLFVVIESIVGLICFVLSILGIVNALNGKAKELPYTGKFRLLK